MSTPSYPNIHIFLVQPLSKNGYKEMIVYTDSAQQARNAAVEVSRSDRKQLPKGEFTADTVYADEGMSICIEVEQPNVIRVDNTLEHAQVKYNEVIYDLKKNVAEQVIAEHVL